MKSFAKIWPKAIKYLFGPLILILLFWTIGLQEVWQLLIIINLNYFIIAYVLFILSVFIAAMNLYVLLYPLKKIDHHHYLQYFFASRVTSLVLPGRLGEFSITLFLKKEGVNLGRGIAAVVTDKLITLSCSVVFGLAAIPVFMPETNLWFTALYLVIILLVFIMLLSSSSRQIIKKFILRKYACHFEGFSATLFSYVRENKGMAVLNLLITLLRIAVIALSAKAMFMSLSIDIPIFTLILISGLETMSNSIPLTVNGLGIKQAMGIYVFSALGISPVATGARYIIGLFIQYSFGFLTTLFLDKNMLKEKEIVYENTH